MKKHDGIYFKWSDCDHKANTKGALTVHIKRIIANYVIFLLLAAHN